MKICVDSNLLIYLFEKNPEYIDDAMQLLVEAPTKGASVGVSELAFLELLSSPNLSDRQAEILHSKAKKLQFITYPIGTGVLTEAARLRRRFPSLKTPDAIHLATACLHSAELFVTNDAKLKKPKIQNLRIVSPKEAARLSDGE